MPVDPCPTSARPDETDRDVTQRVVICPTKEPERHQLGEFPMSCYRCHIEADS